MKLTHDIKIAAPITSGNNFKLIPLSFYISPAYRAQSISCRKLIDSLIAENLRHAGTENGNLICPYNQLEEEGMSRNQINKAITEAEALGLILVERGQYRSRSRKHATRFTLTLFASRDMEQPDKNLYIHAADNWKHWQKITEEEAVEIARRFDKRKRREKKKLVSQLFTG